MSKVFVHNSTDAEEGAGARVRRLFPVAGMMNFDPFVLWDEFTVPQSAGFPDHPHRGFEGVTYVFEGTMQHKDNLGNDSTVSAGGLQRFTAGKGIVHSEMPSSDVATRGIQLWVNLPRRLKQHPAEYQQVSADEVRETQIEQGSVRELTGTDAALKLLTPTRYLDLSLNANATYTETLPAEFRGFVYLVMGQASVNHTAVNAGQAIFFETGGEIEISAASNCRCMLCFGKPHNEPIYQHGPYVD
ncbi:MAG: pirin family protein [Gammaproteobacteria bacterium]